MKVLSSLKSAKNRHPDCKTVKRKGKIYVTVKRTQGLKLDKGRLPQLS